MWSGRVGILVERFKIALDCFFAVWFVVGTVWVFGGHSSSSEAPNLYRQYFLNFNFLYCSLYEEESVQGSFTLH